MNNPKHIIYNGKQYHLRCDYYVRWDNTQIPRKSILLHRQIWEDNNGRKLKQEEVIHHIDGNPYNNNLSNLQCMEKGEHHRLHKTQPLKKNNNISKEFKLTTVNLRKKEDLEYIKRNKMKLSSFVRQAIQAHKQGKFDYNYL